MVHQAKAWKGKAKEFETESQKKSLHIHQLEEQLKKKDEELATANSELVLLRDDKEKMIDEYLDSAEYKSLMDQHDDMLFPGQFTQGWNEAKEAILKKHPSLFQPSEFPCPYLPIAEAASSDELFGEEDALVKEHADKFVRDREGQESTSHAPSPSPSRAQDDPPEEA